LNNESRAKENTRLGEAMVQSNEKKPVDKENASKLANILEGLVFPSDKVSILLFLMLKPSNGKSDLLEILQNNLTEFQQYTHLYEIENLLQILQNNLTDNHQYTCVYEIEKKAGFL
jgi:hypothetical protein